MPSDKPEDEQQRKPASKPPMGDEVNGVHPDSDAPTLITPPRGTAVPPADDVTMATNLNRPLPGAVDDATLVTNLNQAASDPEATMATTPAGNRPASGTALTMPMEDAPQRQPSAELMLDGQVIGDFAIERKLGQGGMGAVFKGRQVSLDRPVAIKVLPGHLSQDRSFIERFQLEAKAVAKITSPYIIQVYGAGESDGLHYFAMEYVDGQDLSERLKSGFRPSPEEAVDLLLQAAKGLAAAGEHGIIHRDIKPHNMMVTDDGQLKIMDFGLVKVGDGGQGLTMTGAVMGTVSYFSPEQGRGLTCDQRTDIYAFGVVLYEVLTGTLPFTGPDATAVIYQHIHSAPRPLIEINPDVPEDLQAVVLKCMQKKPADRYQKAVDLVRDLERIAQGLRPEEALRDPALLRSGATMVRQEPFAAERRGSPVGLILGLLVLGGLGAGGWWYYDQHLRPKPTVSSSSGNDGPVKVEIAGDPDQQEAALAIEAGDWQRAELLIAPHRGDDAVEAWKRLDQRLLASRSQALALEADDAIKAGNIQAANAAIEALAALAPDDPRLPVLQAKLGSGEDRIKQIQSIRDLLGQGEAAKAVAACDQLLATKSNDETVVALRERARGMQALLQTADERLASGAFDTALGMYTTMLAENPNDLARRAVAAVDISKALHAAIAAGELDVASARLGELQEAMPGSQTLAAGQSALQRARLLADGRSAIERGAWADVETAIAALRSAGATKQAGTLAQEQAEQQALAELQLILSGGDLAAARAQVEKIEALTSDEAVLAAAREALTASKLEAKAAADAAAAKEQAIAAAFAAVERDLAAGKAHPDMADQRLAALIERHGRDRQEVARLEVLIADRRAFLAAADLLKRLDAAVTGSAAIADDLVGNADLAAAYAAIGRHDGLVFSHQVQAIERGADGIQVDAVLHHGFDIYPERDITCRLHLARAGDGWVIADAAYAGQ